MIRYKINEIFWSAQGEGSRAGHPSVFIRLSGCTLQCDYCDTKNSWLEGNIMSVSEIIERVAVKLNEFPESQIVITGGEPLEQDLSALVDKLKKENLFISIETNGINFQELDINWWTISPKDKSNFKINESLKRYINEVKLIVNSNLTLDVIRKIRENGYKFPIFLQPQFYDPGKYEKTFDFYKKCQESGEKNIILGYQLHRFYNIE